jgi:RHS repeat-associated protein
MKNEHVSRFLTALLLTIGFLPSLASAELTYYHLDGLGNVRAMTDETGVVVERHDYLPFGEECATAPCAPVEGAQPKRFTGKERDEETGLDYFGARYYSSKTARFTTQDPVYTWSENLFDPQRWNRYSYVRNNPLRYVDPDGRELRPQGSAQFQKDFIEAMVRVDSATNVLRLLRARTDVVVIVQETQSMRTEDLEYEPNGRVIYWNSRAGIRTRHGNGLSPATVLAHEGDHALRHLMDPDGFTLDKKPDGSRYSNAEDKRVITKGAERAVASANEETLRDAHDDGTFVPVDSVRSAPGPAPPAK